MYTLQVFMQGNHCLPLLAQNRVVGLWRVTVVSHDGVCQQGIIPDRLFDKFAAKHHLYNLRRRVEPGLLSCGSTVHVNSRT